MSRKGLVGGAVVPSFEWYLLPVGLGSIYLHESEVAVLFSNLKFKTKPCLPV